MQDGPPRKHLRGWNTIRIPSGKQMSRRLKKKAGPEKGTARPSGTPGCPVDPDSRWTILWVCVFLMAAVGIVFGQTLRDDFINYDDNVYVYEDAAVTHGLTLKGVAAAFSYKHSDNWVPLTTISHMLDCQGYGLNAGGHHLTNVLLHAAAAILLFLVLRQMTGALWRSAFVAAVFAIHPLRVESVAWVAERKDMLSGVFFMLTLWAYVRYVRSPKPVIYYLAMMFIFALGLMSKPTVVTLPLVLLLLDYWPLNRFGPSTTVQAGAGAAGWPKSFSVPLRLVIEKIPLLMLSFASCIPTVLAEKAGLQPMEAYPLHLRIENALVSYVIHIGRMIYPAKLAVFYPYPHNGLPPWEVILAVILLAGISATAWARRRRQPWLLAGWLWYLGMLVPMIGFIQVGAQAQADRHTYLPQIGLYLLLTWAAADLCAGWRHHRVVLGGGGTAILVALIFCAHLQASYWRNSESLWTHTLACTSDNAVAHNNLGGALLQKGQVNEAIAQWQQALEIKPNYADPYNSLGNALLQKGRPAEAITQFQMALQINPDYEAAHYNLGNALLQQGNLDEAITQFQTALQINSGDAAAHNNLGDALLQKGNLDEAIFQFRAVLQSEPDLAATAGGPGNILFPKGGMDNAIAHSQMALQTDPDYAPADYAAAHYNLGNALLQKGSVDDAITQFQNTLQSGPGTAEVYNNLGSALLQKGRAAEAIAQFQMALQINPAYAAAHNNLGNALLQKGSPAEAITQFQMALKIKPDYLEVQNNLAWVLATAPQASLRDGNKAVELARQANALAGGENPIFLHTLAAACAESGQFSEAISTAQKARELARAAGRQDLAAQLNNELKRYEAGLPLHQ
jgi:protein O-mannosyl-transferase